MSGFTGMSSKGSKYNFAQIRRSEIISKLAKSLVFVLDHRDSSEDNLETSF